MVYLLLYLINLIPNIQTIFVSIVIIAFIGLILITMIFVENSHQRDECLFALFKKWLKIDLTVISLAAIICAILPSQETLYAMSAVYLGKQVGTSIQIDKKLEKVSTLIDLQLDKSIKELRK